MPKAGLTDSGCGRWALAGDEEESTASGGREESGERRPSPAQPSCPRPRAQDPSNACCTAGVQAGRQAVNQSGQVRRRQASRQALQIRHA